MGRDSNSLIQIVEDTSKGPGDRVRVTLRMLLTGAGIQGDSTLEGNEESLVTYTDDLLIDQLRHAVRSGGKMSEQRIPFSVREEARMGLVDWWSDRIDTWAINQLAGVAGPQTAGAVTAADTRYTGNNAVTAGDRDIYAGGTTLTTVNTNVTASAHVFKIELLDAAVEIAKTAAPQIRPIRYDGGEYYVCFLHPTQVRDLRKEDSSRWLDIQKAAMQGGDVKNNPIFSGALGMYNGVILHESTRVPLSQTSASATAHTHARSALFLGAQAGIMAFGRGYGQNRMSWVEELFDYQNQLGVSAGMIAGVKKTEFNGSDFGVIKIHTNAIAASA